MSTISGMVFDIKRYSIHDGPGIRTTVFFKGCPLRCWWCHNPESQSLNPELMLRTNRCLLCAACEQVCPQQAIHSLGGEDTAMPVTDRSLCQVCGKCVEACYSGARELVGRKMTVSAVMAEIERERPFYDQSGGGVTFSGGEPLMQPAFLLALLHACREVELHTTLDTSGYAPWRVLEQALPLVDLFLYDLKLVDESRHRLYTGASNRLILRNLRRLSQAGANLVVRIPLVPGVNDDEQSLRLAGKYLSSLPRVAELELMPYHASAEAKYEALGMGYKLPGLKPPTPEKLAEAAQVLQSYGLRVSSQSVMHTAIPEVYDDNQCACPGLTPAVAGGS